jgi:hypothetical protein
MLWAAHDLGDHVVQTDHQAAGKATSWRAMAGHLVGYHATQAAAIAVLRSLGVRPSWRATAAGIAFSAASHAFLDRRWPVARLLEHTGSTNFARPQVRVVVAKGFESAPRPISTGVLPLHGPYLADQALHHLALTVVALILAGCER